MFRGVCRILEGGFLRAPKLKPRPHKKRARARAHAVVILAAEVADKAQV